MKIDTHKGLIAWFARNGVAANLLMVIIIVAGLVSAFTIKKQVFPDIELNLLQVQVPYLGAAPQEVEEGIVFKIEEAIEGLDGIQKVTSTASEGFASVTIEVTSEFDPQVVLDEVKMRVDAIPSFPDNIEKPTIRRIRPTNDVMWIALYGDVSETLLKETAKDIRDEIAAMDGISNVQVMGARPYEVSIEVAEIDLQAYGMTLQDLVNAIRRSSIDLPGGSIKTENGDILLRAKGQAYTGHDFEQLVLMTRPDGTRLLLSDIATIKDGFIEQTNYATFDRKDAINVKVSSVGEQDALGIAKDVRKYLEKKRKELPPGVQMDDWGDISQYLQGRLDLMLSNMFWGALLVFLILSTFLRFRLAFWVIIGLPICFTGTLLLMPMDPFNVSINMLSLFGFILVLGIVVDDAIIIGESAYAEVEERGHSAESVIAGAKRVAMPATFGVLTTIAAFAPMLMVSGVFGTILKAIGLVVVFCLIFSLVESKLILPAHLVHSKLADYDPANANALQRFRDRFAEGIKSFVTNKYQPFLEKSIRNRYTTLAAFLGALILVIGLMAGGWLKMVFFPDLPSDFIQVQLELVEGSTEKQRDGAINQIVNAMYDTEEGINGDTGESALKHILAFDQGKSSAVILVELTKDETREIDGVQVANLWRDRVGEIPGLKSLEFQASTGTGGGPAMMFQLSGQNLETLALASKEIQEKLVEYAGIYDVKDTFSGGNDEIRLKIKPEAEALGLSLSDLARQVRYGFYGAEAQRIQRGDEEVKVMVRYPLEQRNSIGHLENMRIRTPQGDEIPFAQVAEIEMGKGYARIQRVNGVRAITIQASADKEQVDPSKVAADIRKGTIPAILKKYPDVSFKLEGASAEQEKVIFQMMAALAFSLFAIYALLAVPLKSYSQPLIIMSVIPFGAIGAVMGHLMLGYAFSFLSFMGIIALSGVVVNDSLIMVDFVNKARQQGVSVREAAIQSGGRRFRAIVLTSLTTFLGLMPIVMEQSLQAKIVIPMAVSLAFGILFATVITLILIPSLYVILEDFKGFMRKKKPKVTEPTSIGALDN